MSKLLFDKFDAVTSKQWKQKIQFDLKGADYNDLLIWKTSEAISVKPFYNSEDLKDVITFSNTKTSQWNICQSIYVNNVEKSNKKALDVIKKGTDTIKFIIPDDTVSIQTLLENIDISLTPIHFEFQFLSETYIQQFSKIQNKETLYIHNDIIGNLAKSGNWFSNITDDHLKFESAVNTLNTVSINTSLYQNAGASMLQQLAYGLSHANEYLNYFDSKLKEDTKEKLKVVFNVAVGTNYFFEIAKLRALRILWSTLASEYGFNNSCFIITEPTKRNKTLYDYNTNLLRTTTECMSAVLGGSNTVNNLPYDAIYHKNNKFSERISRNQLLILKHESYFSKVDNPCDGSYYIESLTNQLSEKALELFKNIEAHGGFLKQLKEGTIQRKIKESAHAEQKYFDQGKKIILGSNKHPNPNDTMKHELELYPFVKTNQRKTLIEPIIGKRLTETLEQERLKKEI